MITILEQNINTPAWAKGLFLGIFILVFYFIKNLFIKKEQIEINAKENGEVNVFSIKLSNKSKIGWINRIDYWIENRNYDEAVKLCNYYTSYFGFDDDINPRIKRVNNLIKNI